MKTILLILLLVISGESQLQAAKLKPIFKSHRPTPVTKQKRTSASITETLLEFRVPALMNMRPMKHKDAYIFNSK